MKPMTNSHTLCHCVAYGWDYSKNKIFPFLPETPGTPSRTPKGSPDPILRKTLLVRTAGAPSGQSFPPDLETTAPWRWHNFNNSATYECQSSSSEQWNSSGVPLQTTKHLQKLKLPSKQMISMIFCGFVTVTEMFWSMLIIQSFSWIPASVQLNKGFSLT